jgi:hypothetical protein
VITSSDRIIDPKEALHAGCQRALVDYGWLMIECQAPESLSPADVIGVVNTPVM